MLLLIHSQAKMAKSSVLFIHCSGVSSEVLKNLVLAGIRAVLCDDRPYPSAMHSTPSFFLSQEDRSTKVAKQTVAEAMRPKIEEINPLLGECQVCSYAELTDEFLKGFSIVVCSRLPSQSEAIRLSKGTVAGGGKFYMVDTFGLQGACAFDLGANHTFRGEKGKELGEARGLKEHIPLDEMLKTPLQDAINRFHKKPPIQWIQYKCILEFVETTKTWPSAANASVFATTTAAWIAKDSPSLTDHPALTEDSLQKLAKVATAEVAPVCSVLGGILGNEIIKAISGKGEPANNTLLLDGTSCKLWSFLVKPKK